MDQGRNAFIERLYKQYFKKLFRIAYRETGDVGAAEVLVQDVFVLALLHYDELANHPAPEGWLVLTLHRQAIDQRRLRERRQELPLDEALEVTLEAAQADGIVELLPTQLSKADKDVLLWRYEQQLDYAEIADRLGISEAACRSRVSRAVAKCRKILKNSS